MGPADFTKDESLNRRMERGIDHVKCGVCGTEYVYGETWVFMVRTRSLGNLLNAQFLHEHVRAKPDRTLIECAVGANPDHTLI